MDKLSTILPPFALVLPRPVLCSPPSSVYLVHCIARCFSVPLSELRKSLLPSSPFAMIVGPRCSRCSAKFAPVDQHFSISFIAYWSARTHRIMTHVLNHPRRASLRRISLQKCFPFSSIGQPSRGQYFFNTILAPLVASRWHTASGFESRVHFSRVLFDYINFRTHALDGAERERAFQ